MKSLGSRLAAALLLVAGPALAIGTGPTQPQAPQPPLQDQAPREEVSPPDRTEPQRPPAEGVEAPPHDPRERERERQGVVPIEPEAQRDR